MMTSEEKVRAASAALWAGCTIKSTLWTVTVSGRFNQWGHLYLASIPVFKDPLPGDAWTLAETFLEAEVLKIEGAHQSRREQLQAILGTARVPYSKETGRAFPPTMGEIYAHQEAGGLWRWVGTRDGELMFGLCGDLSQVCTRDPLAGIPIRIGSHYEVRYWALNSRGEVTDWPKG